MNNVQVKFNYVIFAVILFIGKSNIKNIIKKVKILTTRFKEEIIQKMIL